MSYNAWTKIDSGSEGAWTPDVWLGVIKIIANHQGENVYDGNSPIYQELENCFPSLKWRDTNGGNFRPYFRDFSKPWTITGVASFNDSFSLTPRGSSIANGDLSVREFFVDFCESYFEDNEYPFAILAAGFFEASKQLSLHEIYFGIEMGYRPGKDDIAVSLSNSESKTIAEIPATHKRRLVLMLKIMERIGAIVAIGTGEEKAWMVWDSLLLKRLKSADSSGSSPTSTTDKPTIDGIVLAYLTSAKSANYLISSQVSLNLIASLLAKPFLILTGLSGSGKTKLAQTFAAWISSNPDQYRIVAVGADWTSGENILGYPDALRAGYYCKPSNGALDIILKARDNPQKPYFLILDEMNLSHVERYFSDILSVIESKQQIALHASSCALKSSGDETEIPATIKFPENLFLIGTVNIDETTYMFSPKVLDRANVLEFRVSAPEISNFLGSPKSVDIDMIAGKGAEYAEAFVKASRNQDLDFLSLDDQITKAHEIAKNLNENLTEIFTALSKVGAEFGFRTGIEIFRFTFFHALLTGTGWNLKDAIDAQILQKLLPKLHGSERRLGPLLNVLREYCEQNQYTSSLIKIKRMQDRLRDGFTSFAEA